MGFRISPLKLSEFQHLFNADKESLERAGVVRMEVDVKPGFPCRVSLEDAEIGETVLLMNYEHLSVATPYRSNHAIIIRENAVQASSLNNAIPEQIRIRLMSVRAFNKDGMMVDADVAHGEELEPLFDRMLSDSSVDYLHLHNAKPGCYAARVDRLDVDPAPNSA